MALNPALLEAEILKIIKPDSPNFPRSIPEAAAAWANAYGIYAKGAMDASKDVLASGNQPGFQGSLKFIAPTGNPATAAAEFGAAFIAFWTGATFVVGTPPLVPAPCPWIPPSVVSWQTEITSTVISAVPGSLVPALTSEFARYESRSPEAKAKSIAGHFHAATISGVLVLITGIGAQPGIPPTVPVTLTCNIS